METKVALTQEDIDEINQSTSFIRTIVIASIVAIIIGVILLFFIDSFISNLLIGVGILFFIVATLMGRKFKKDIEAGVKYVQQGIVTEKEIGGANTRDVTYTTLDDDRIRIELRTMGKKETHEQPLELPPGMRDEFFYFITVNNQKHTISRKQFFEVEVGMKIELERLESRQVHKLTVI